MFIDTRWGARAAEELEPISSTTGAGIQIRADWTNALVQDGPWTNTVKIAWRAYTSAKGRDTGRAVLFVPGERLSGAMYHETALWLAEKGIAAYAMTLAPNGIGHWHSSDPRGLGHLSLQHCLDYVVSVIQEMRVPAEKLVLAGDGLGGILAQLYAIDHPNLAGLVLLGSCSPHRASAVWPVPSLDQRNVWQPPTSTEVRWLLGETATDEEALALKRELGPLPLHIRQDYCDLARQEFKRPPCLVLILAGEHDRLIPREIHAATAADYGEALILMPEAPHLLTQCRQRQGVLEHIEAFGGKAIT